MLRRVPNIIALLGFNPTGDLGPFTIYTAHDRRPVVFPKAPPKEPPSWKQREMQAMFRYAAMAWRGLTPELRARWQLAATRAHLKITGYNLWTYYQVTQDLAPIHTIERLSGLQLIPV